MSRLPFNLPRTVVLYVDPSTLIAFAPGDPEYATYLARLLAVATPYSYLSPIAISGHASNTFEAACAVFDDLDAEGKEIVMHNAEIPWSTQILVSAEGDAVPAAWHDGTYPQVAEEFVRQGRSAPNGSTPREDYVAVAEQLWRDIDDYALANGARVSMHYATTGVPFSNYLGLPRGGVRSSAPSSGVSWWQSAGGIEILRDSFDDVIDAGIVGNLSRAQRNASMHGAAAYCFVPNGARSDVAIGEWQSASVTRKNSAGTTVTPDWDSDDTRHHVRNTSGRMWAEYRRALTRSIELGKMSSTDRPSLVASVILGCGAHVNTTGFSLLQHWTGLGQQDPQRWADDVGAAMFEGSEDGDTPTNGPDAIFVWDNATHYNITLATNAKASNSAIPIVRWGHEVDFSGRSIVTTGGSAEFFGTVGGKTEADHLAWFDAICKGDSIWSTPSAVLWTPGGGNQMGADCPFDPIGGPLAPFLTLVNASYASSDITTAIKTKAIRHAVSERKVSGVELLHARLVAMGRAV